MPLPQRCLVCRCWACQPVCPACRQRFAPLSAIQPRCSLCGLRVPAGVLNCADCRRDPPPQRCTRVAVDYRHPWDALVQDYKFRGHAECAAGLADLLAAAVAESGHKAVDLIVPIPLSHAGLRRRGFNQAWEIARRVGRRLRHPARSDVLEKWVDLPQQAAADRAQRLERLRGVLGVPAGQRHRVRDRRVAVVDDVYTTGATGAEAVRALMEAGAAAVEIWAFARTPPRPDGPS